jgi:beta-glucosidase
MIRRDGLAAALASGEVTEADIDRCVERTVAGLLRHATDPDRDATVPDATVVAGPAHEALAREAAAKAVVLLQNAPVDGVPVLPIDPAVARVAVLGRLAVERNLGDGGSSDVYAPSVVTPLDGLRAALPQAEVVHADSGDLEAASALAAASDLAVVVVGYTRADEGEYIGDSGTAHLRALLPGPDEPDVVAAFEARLGSDPVLVEGSVPTGDAMGFSTGGDRERLTLHDADEALIDAVAAANPRTVVCLVAGSAVLAEGWRHRVPALAQVWYSGMQGGHGIADVLTGAVDATGRLPFTVPTDGDHLPPFDRDADAVTYDGWHGYWRLARDRHEPAFPFGFGLSYTSWRPGATTLDDEGDDLVVRTELTNTGARDSADVVQVYAGRPADRTRPARRLVGFARVEVAAGDTAEVVLRIPWSRLAVRDPQARAWALPAGTYVLTVGRHSADLDAVDLVVDRP